MKQRKEKMKEIQRFLTKEAAEQEAQCWEGARVYYDGEYWIMEAYI